MLAREFGRFAAAISFGDLAAQDVDLLKYRILDVVGAGLAGCQLGNGQRLEGLIRSGAGATGWGSGEQYAVREASLLNCFLAHSTYLEDGSRFTGGHPSSVVVPSALALAEAAHLDGRTLLAAVAAGYEINLRLGRAIYPSTVNRGFKSTAVLGAVSSAAAAARLLGLDEEGAKNAIAIACTLGTGLKEALLESSGEPIQVARACEGGVFAALFAQAGAKGAESIIENGFIRAYCDVPAGPKIAENLGHRFSIAETYLKLHGGCRGNHAPLDVVQDLISRHEIGVADIESIDVTVDSVTYAAEFENPRDGAQAQFSIGFSIAVLLLKGNASIFQYTDEVLAEAPVRELMRRVAVKADKALDANYPAMRGAAAVVRLRDGRQYAGFLENALGEPESPISKRLLEDKFAALAQGVLGAGTAPVLEAILSLERCEDVSQIARRLRFRHESA